MNEITNRLAAMNTTWQNTKVHDTDPPEEGVYTAKISSCGPRIAKSGDLLLITELLITSGDLQGKRWSVIHSLEKEDRLVFAKRWLSDLGVDCEDLTQLQSHLQAVLDLNVTVQVKQNGEYRNTYLLGVLGSSAGAPATDTSSAKGFRSEDDIPF